MKRRLNQLLLSTLLACGVLVSSTTDAALKTTGVERYDVAVADAVAYLQKAPVAERENSLVAYALLKAGVDPSEPRLAHGIAAAERRGRAARYDAYPGVYIAAVDAMLLAEVDGKRYRSVLQQIADRIESFQRPDGSWHDPSFGPEGPGDVSVSQYGILGLWAAQRSGCRVSPRSFDKVATLLTRSANEDGGWPYRIVPASRQKTTTQPRGVLVSKETMTVAAIGTIGISRLLLFPDKRAAKDNPQASQLRALGVLAESKKDKRPNPFAEYEPTVNREEMQEKIVRGLQWRDVRHKPIPVCDNKLYFYYSLERAAALVGLSDGWFTTFGDALLTLQHTDGHFDGKDNMTDAYGPASGTSFAILYYMRSTQQILDYGKGVQVGSRDLVEFLHPKSRTRKPIGPLDDLLAAMEGQNFADLDVNTDEVVEKIQFSSREELIGQADKLKVLLKSSDPANRQIAYWALSRTGDFDLVPLMLDGLNDPDLNVNIEVVAALRYISRRPKGFNLSLTPLSKLPRDADEQARLNTATVWREKAGMLWRAWYSGVRPYQDRDGLDEIRLPVE